MPDTATLDAAVIRPNWSTVITETLVAPPYVPVVTAVFAKPTRTLPEDELAVNWPELANNAVLVTETFDAPVTRPCALTTRTGIAEELPYVAAPTPVVSILALVTEPSDGTCVVDPLPMCRKTTLLVPDAGAVVKVTTVPLRVYNDGA